MHASFFARFLTIRLTHGNFPDEVWTRLKAWARVQAIAGASPTREQCVQCVERICKEITGRADALRPEVAECYAAETAEMIAKFRNDGVSDTNLEPA